MTKLAIKILLVTVLFISCQPNDKDKESTEEAKDSVPLTTSSVPYDPATDSLEEAVKNLGIDTTKYPYSNEKNAYQLLKVGDYFNNQFDFKLDSAYSAIGLFRYSRLDKTIPEKYQGVNKKHKITFTKSMDCNFVLSFDSSDTWKQYKLKVIDSDVNSNPYFLLYNSDIAHRGFVPTYFSGKKNFYNFKEKFYESYEFTTPAGTLKLTSVAPDDLEERIKSRAKHSSEPMMHISHKLYAQFGLKKTLITDRLYSLIPGGSPYILWIGDLDNDNIPDILLDLDGGEKGCTDLHLFLSSLASEGKLYGLARTLYTTAC